MNTRINDFNTNTGWNVNVSGSSETAKKTGAGDRNNTEKRDTIDARGLKANTDASSRAEQTRENARKKALKLIKDAWETDEGLADSKKTIDDQKISLVTENNTAAKNIDRLAEKREQILQNSGIDPNSDEYKDLELLEKYQRNAYGNAGENFSEDEYKRLGELQDKPLTQTQQDVLSVGAAKLREQSRMTNNDAALSSLNKSQHDALMNELKSQDMTKAQNTKDDLLEAADRDVISIASSDVLQKAKEEQKEQEEKSQEAAEKADADKERLDNAKQKRQEQEQRIEAQQQANADSSASQIDNSDQHQIITSAAHLEEIKAPTGNTSATDSSTHVQEVQKQLSSDEQTFKITREDLLGLRIDVML